ncbi:unnamed protein product [Chironomus riparius]|uniref:Tudor domain-containing protein n=1 Tax=Chironomus riparius TaxID=315576 RepID=A0A9N9RZ78_9DIPT|nr:unnamed protein product [Chironomus riparius]
MQENICGNCQKSANLLCMRCSTEYYCSKKCQVTAFPVHRKECFSIPPLKAVNGEPNLLQTSNISLDSDDSDKISIAGLKKPDDEIKTVTLQKKHEEVPKKVETMKLITPAFNPGIRTVPPNDVKASPSVMSISKPAIEKEKVVEEVAKPTEKKQAFSLETIRRNQQNTLMNQQQKKQTPSKEPRIFLNELKVRLLPIGQVKVKILGEHECPKTFYVTEALDAVDAFLEHIEIGINDYVKNEKSKSYKPVMNEIVLARFEGVYYRAVIENIINDDPAKPVYGVFFIDYGNVSQVTEDDLLAFPSKLKGEIILHPVFLQNFPTVVTKKLEEIVTCPEGFDIVIQEKSDKGYIANIVGI